MNKRRIIMILVVLGVLTVIAGGIGMYWYRNTGARLLSRASFALQQKNYEKASSLAGRYIKADPDEWEGYYVKGVAESRMLHETEARKLLEKAVEIAPSETRAVLEYSRAYSEPAFRVMNLQRKSGTKKETGALVGAIKDLEQAIEALGRGKPKSDKGRLDLKENEGTVRTRIAEAHRMLARQLKREAESRVHKTPERRQALREESEAAQADSDAAYQEATRVLLEVIRQDSRRGKAAELLYDLAKIRNDTEVLDEVRKIILGMENPPATARIRLMMEDLAVARETMDRAGWRRKARESEQVLDSLIEANPRNIEAKRLRAQLALFREQDAVAEKLCKDILKLDRDHAHARLLLAKVNMRRGNVTEAERDLFKLATQYKNWAEAQFSYAQAAMALGKKQLAMKHAREASLLNPKDTRVRNFMAEYLAGSGDLGQALDQAMKAFRNAPDDLSAVGAFIHRAKQAKQEKAARQELERVREEMSSSPEVLRAVAVGYSLLGDNEESTKVMRVLAEMKPTNSKGRLAVAAALIVLRKSNQAEKILQEELNENPDNPGACFVMGNLYAATKRRTQALEMYRKAVELDDQNAQYRLSLAQLLFDMDDLAEARLILAPMDKNNTRAALLNMQIAIAERRPVEAEEILTRINTEQYSALPLALLSLRTKQVDRCVEICRAELKKEQQPRARMFHSILAQALVNQGKRKEAVDHLIEALKLDPGRLISYNRLARVLSLDHKAGDIERIMSNIPGADVNNVDLALGSLMNAQKKYSLARVVFERLADRESAPRDARYRARLLLADSLAREKRVDEALTHLKVLIDGEGVWRKEGLLAKARLMMLASRFQDAGATLEILRKMALDKKDSVLFRQVARMYLQMKQMPQARAVCAELQKMMPDDARTYLLLADVLLAQEKKVEAIAAVETAIKKQPNNFQTYIILARLLDREEKRGEALAVLDRLAAVGQAGRNLALLERGRLMASWGLHAQAAKAFQEVARLGYSKNPKLLFQLGRVLAEIGRKPQARKHFSAIPPHADTYLAAQIMLADLADKPEESLAILTKLNEDKPGQVAVLAKTMQHLLRADRRADAIKLFNEFSDALPQKKRPVEVAPLALGAMLESGDRAAAVKLAETMLEQTKAPAWRRMTMLLKLDVKDAEAANLLPPVAEAGIHEAIMGLYLAAKQGKTEQAKTWQGRLNKIQADLQAMTPERSMSVRLRLLAALSAGVSGMANQYLEQIPNRGFADNVVARELVAHVAKAKTLGPDQYKAALSETLLLLKAETAAGQDASILARKWAMQALEARGTCQWAAATIVKSRADDDTVRKVLTILKPADCALAKAIRARMAHADGRYEEAAGIYDQLAQALPDDPVIAMHRAMVTDQAGRREDALKQYVEIVKKTGNPAAANNAAYLVCQKYPKDAAKLAEANSWARAAAEKAPRMSELNDTIGWIAHLRGLNHVAVIPIRKAVRGSPTSVENHYHLGAVEAALGHWDLARWHLQAAIDLVSKARAENKPVPPARAEAARLAADALLKVKRKAT